MAKKYFLLIYLLSLALLISCGLEKPNKSFNTYGDGQRTNSYEELGTFWSGIAYVEKLNVKDTTGFAQPPLALSGSKFVVATNAGSIALFEHTSLLWEKPLGDSEFVVSNFVADPKENIYFLSNKHKLYSFSIDGQKNWTIKIDDTTNVFSTLLATNNAIYFSSESGKLFKISFTGKIEWALPLPLPTTPTFAEFDGNLVINITNNSTNLSDSILFIEKSGKIRWSRQVENTRLVKSPVIASGRIYAIGYRYLENTTEGRIICIDTLGRIIWNKSLPIIPRFISVSRSGELFLVLYNLGIGETLSSLYELNRQGEIIAHQFVNTIFYTPVLISEDKIALLGYTKETPSMLFFDKELNLLKSIDLSKIPPPIVQPAVLTDCTIIFATSNGPYLVRIDENPIIKLLPW